MSNELLYGSVTFMAPGGSGGAPGGGVGSNLPGRNGFVSLYFRDDALVGFPSQELKALRAGAELPAWVWFLCPPPEPAPAPAPYALRVSRSLHDFDRADVDALADHMSALLKRAELRPYVPHKFPGFKGWPAGARALAELKAYYGALGEDGWADRYLRRLGVLEAAANGADLPTHLRWPLAVLQGSAALNAELQAVRV